MDFIETIKTDMYSAMKLGQKEKVNILRTLLAKLKDFQINEKKSLTKREGISIIRTLVKQHKESIEMYKKASRKDLAEKEVIECEILNTYLPKMMNEKSIRELVQIVISETSADNISDIGKVMPLVMQRGEGTVDGKIANKILREILG